MTWRRIASGHYESGPFMLWRIPDVYPPAWNVEDTRTFELLVDGAATKRDAIALLDLRHCAEPDWIELGENYKRDTGRGTRARARGEGQR